MNTSTLYSGMTAPQIAQYERTHDKQVAAMQRLWKRAAYISRGDTVSTEGPEQVAWFHLYDIQAAAWLRCVGQPR
jgi:ABC-type tungstate transport system permease subunit